MMRAFSGFTCTFFSQSAFRHLWPFFFYSPFGPFWPIFTISHPFFDHFDQSRPLSPALGHFWPFLSHFDIFGHFCPIFVIFGTFFGYFLTILCAIFRRGIWLAEAGCGDAGIRADAGCWHAGIGLMEWMRDAATGTDVGLRLLERMQLPE